jgi:hypothetical protein
MCGPLVSSLVAPSGSSIFAIMLCEGTFHEAARAPRRSRGSGHSGSRRESEERPLFGYQPRCSGISGRRPQRRRNGRNRARPRQKNRGILPGTRRSAPPCVPEQGSVQARISGSRFCLLNGTPRRIFLQGSCPPSQNVWFPIRPSRCRQPRSLGHPQTGRKVTLPHHSGDMAEGRLRDSPRSWN